MELNSDTSSDFGHPQNAPSTVQRERGSFEEHDVKNMSKIRSKAPEWTCILNESLPKARQLEMRGRMIYMLIQMLFSFSLCELPSFFCIA